MTLIERWKNLWVVVNGPSWGQIILFFALAVIGLFIIYWFSKPRKPKLPD